MKKQKLTNKKRTHKLNPKSEPFRCFRCRKNKIKRFLYGTVQQFIWDNKQRAYVSNGEPESIFLCSICRKCPEPTRYGLCEFTDTDNNVSHPH